MDILLVIVNCFGFSTLVFGNCFRQECHRCDKHRERISAAIEMREQRKIAMLVMATPHIGNYGVHSAENESGSTQIAGLVVRNFSEVASRIGDIEPLAARAEA